METVSTPLTENARVRIAQVVAEGGLLVTPTDTIYGIGAQATDSEAVRKLLAAKGRGRQMPPPVVAAKISDLSAVVTDFNAVAQALAQAFWPGALTLILPARADYVSVLGDLRTLAVRIPDHGELLSVLEHTGPLALTSANLTQAPPALSCSQAIEYFHQEVDIYIDGGTVDGGVPSTIVDVTGVRPRLLRMGAISLAELNQALSALSVTVEETQS
ncbi:L-threonylcarbamoyladenylate synthase [Boudabousia marimammalium]|uniref:L-threonylcarbamoyladenylate synthase n=1 Tax=Boudabousia marimammalium TaxID=156892 RepID=UPI000A6F592E|nr:L-threonylcarbamoyladenylate synthase [Boudabousia marimammalium]